MELTLNVSPEAKNILEIYDENDLLRTVPNDYKLNSNMLNIYKKRIKSLVSVQINLSSDRHTQLKSYADNANAPMSLVFSFLIENVVDCGKINTKNIKQALDCYYYAVAHDKSLFSRILEGYSNSGFYYTEETKAKPNPGLNEEGIACFLTLSEERKKYNARI